nr:hypothetical protein [Tanacetum cinerariifolium]
MFFKRNDEGRKRGARLSGGHFIRRLAHHFGVVGDDGLRGLFFMTHELPLIEMGELVKINICREIRDYLAWVAQVVERQPVFTVASPGGAMDALDAYLSGIRLDLARELPIGLREAYKMQDRDHNNEYYGFMLGIKGLHGVTIARVMLLKFKFLLLVTRVSTAVIVNGDAPTVIALVSGGVEAAILPKTTEQKIARKNELKAKRTLLLAISDEHLLKFHGIKDAKTLWEAFKTRSEGLDKTYDKFQKLISQLEIHDEVISQEDPNLKLLISIPPAWNTHTLIMRNKSDLNMLSMDDLYNNLKVYEVEIKGQSSSSSNSNTQNVAFVSLDNTSSTNEAANTSHNVSTASLQGQASASTYADDVMFSFFSNQSNSLQLENEDLEHIDTDDLEAMDLKCQISPKDKTGLGYDSHLNERDLNNKNVVFESASDSSVNESEEDNNQANDRGLPLKISENDHHVLPVRKESNTKPHNRVLVTKPHNKTLYELLIGRSPNLDFMKPFGYHVTILNTLDHLGKFEGKADEGFLVGYFVNRKTRQEKAFDHEFLLLPFMHSNSPVSSSTQSSYDKDTDEVPGKGDKETGIFDDIYDDTEVGAEADINNVELLTVVSSIPTTRVHKDHPKEQIIRDLNLATQTRRMIIFSKENAMVWTLVDLPNGKKAIGTKWVFKNKKDKRGIVVRNKARLVAKCYTQEEGINYDEVFSHVARIEAIRSMIGSLMYLTASRPDIMFAVCACARFQVTPKTSHLHDVKRIFKYLKVSPMIYTSCIKQFWTSSKVKTVNKDVRLQALVDGKKVIVNEASIRRDIGLDDAKGTACLSNAAIFEELVKISAKTTAWNEFSSTMASAIICLANNQKINFSKYIFKSMMKNLEVERVGTGFSGAITPLFETMMVQASEEVGEILTNTQDTPILTQPSSSQPQRKYKSRWKQRKEINVSQDETPTKEHITIPSHDPLPSVVDVSAGEKEEQSENVAKKEVSTTDPVTTAGEVVTTADVEVSAALTTTTTTFDELTMAQTLIEIKAAKLKALTTTATTVTTQPSQPKDKGKAKMVELKRPLKRKEQIMMDEQIARDIEAQMQVDLEKEQRIAKQTEEEANIAMIAEWDNTQAMMDADYELATKLKEDGRGELSIKEKSKLFVELMNKRKNNFEMLRAEKRRRKPPTKAQKRKKMFKHRAVESSKRPKEELESNKSKKQKLDENVQAKVADDDIVELKRCMEIVLEDDDEVTIEAIPLSSKSHTVVDHKIYKEGKKSYFKIIRADGKSQNYLTFGTMFKNFNREDLQVLRSIVKTRFEKIKPVNDMDNLLVQTLKTMFEHQVKDNIWKYQQEAVKTHNWKLFDSCGVYCVTT